MNLYPADNPKLLPKASPQQTALFMNILMKLIISSGLSFRSVENENLKELCRFLEGNNCHFALPSRRKLKKYTREMAENKRNDIKKTLETVKEISVTTDCWSSTKQKIGFIGVTLHFYTNFVLNSLSLGVKKIKGDQSLIFF